MDALQVSAEFAAFVWHNRVLKDGCLSWQKQQQAARRFAQENWASFLPLAHEGLGKLLLRIAGSGQSSPRRRRLGPAPCHRLHAKGKPS